MNKYVGSVCYFLYNILKFIDQSFFVIQWVYLLCITNLFTCKKKQPLHFAQGGCLKYKVS